MVWLLTLFARAERAAIRHAFLNLRPFPMVALQTHWTRGSEERENKGMQSSSSTQSYNSSNEGAKANMTAVQTVKK
jgi:hypothetical protein